MADPEQPPPRARYPWTPLLVGLAATTLFRLPPLLNARGLNSDAAVVGLQAMHFLKGEWSPFLWGTTYQGSFDALLAAAVFAVTGPTALALFLVPFVGMLVLVSLWFDLLRRAVEPWAALACLSPLIFASMAINMPMLYVMRQTLVTVIALGVWLGFQGAWLKRGWPLHAVGGALIGLSLWVDFFGVTLFPASGVLALAAAHQGARSGERSQAPWRQLLVPLAARLGLSSVGLALGLAGSRWLLGSLDGGGNAQVQSSRIGSNWRLLHEVCFPFAVGSKVYIKGEELYAQLWSPPVPVVVLQYLGAGLFVAGLVFALVALPLRRTSPLVRWLGLAGLAGAAAAVGGFLLSIMPVDMWSARYLAPMIWLSPLALAPAAFWLTRRGLWAALAPYLLSAAMGGWLSYGLYVHGPLPRLDPRGAAQEEEQVLKVLEDEGVEGAAAQYWLAYRLTFLWREAKVVVPLNPGEDRFPPYRSVFNGARRRAYLFHPSEPRASPGEYVGMLKAQQIPFEVRTVGGFTILLTGPKAQP